MCAYNISHVVGIYLLAHNKLSSCRDVTTFWRAVALVHSPVFAINEVISRSI